MAYEATLSRFTARSQAELSHSIEATMRRIIIVPVVIYAYVREYFKATWDILTTLSSSKKKYGENKKEYLQAFGQELADKVDLILKNEGDKAMERMTVLFQEADVALRTKHVPNFGLMHVTHSFHRRLAILRYNRNETNSLYDYLEKTIRPESRRS